MKNIIIVFIFIFSSIYSSTSFGDWKRFGSMISKSKTITGTTFIDYERSIKAGEDIYFWILIDFDKEVQNKYFSMTIMFEGDCKIIRTKRLSVSFYEGNMGKGEDTNLPQGNEWIYPKLGTNEKIYLKNACDYFK